MPFGGRAKGSPLKQQQSDLCHVLTISTCADVYEIWKINTCIPLTPV